MTGRLPTITEALAAEREMMGAYRWNQLMVLEPIIMKGLAVASTIAGGARPRWRRRSPRRCRRRPPPTSPQWLKALGKEFLEGRDKMIAAEEASWRRAAPPTTMRATSQPGRTSRAGILSGSMISLQKKRTKYAIGAMFAVLFVLGIAFAMRGTRSPEVAAAAKPEPAPVAAQPVVMPLPPPPVVHDATVAREPAPSEEASKPAATQTTSRPRTVHVVRHEQPARAAVRSAAPPPKSESAPVAAAPAAAKEDCSPPYYFEGRKKIFKSACL